MSTTACGFLVCRTFTRLLRWMAADAPFRRSRASWIIRVAVIGIAVVFAIGGVFAGFVYWEARKLVGELQAGPKRAVVNDARTELGKEPRVSVEQRVRLIVAVAARNPTADAATRARMRARLAAENLGVRTILVVGSDRRWGETGNGRSDTMILVRVDPVHRTLSLLSVPRDLSPDPPSRWFGSVRS